MFGFNAVRFRPGSADLRGSASPCPRPRLIQPAPGVRAEKQIWWLKLRGPWDGGPFIGIALRNKRTSPSWRSPHFSDTPILYILGPASLKSGTSKKYIILHPDRCDRCPLEWLPCLLPLLGSSGRCACKLHKHTDAMRQDSNFHGLGVSSLDRKHFEVVVPIMYQIPKTQKYYVRLRRPK